MTTIEFDITSSKGSDGFIELNKLLKATGLCESGSMANQFISAGEVKVNGEVDTRKRAKIRVGSKILLQDYEITVI